MGVQDFAIRSKSDWESNKHIVIALYRVSKSHIRGSGTTQVLPALLRTRNTETREPPRTLRTLINSSTWDVIAAKELREQVRHDGS